SRPVLVGYLAGMALIMIVGQLGRVTGVRVRGDSLLAELGSFVRGLGGVHLPTLGLALGVLAFLLVAGALWPKLPVPRLGVLAASAVTTVFSLREHGIVVVGAIASGVPSPAVPAVSAGDLSALLLPALGVTIVGYADNVLTARAFATRGGYRIDANAE